MVFGTQTTSRFFDVRSMVELVASRRAVVYQKSSRVAAIAFPRMGWRRGLYVAGIYAPTSASGKEERNTLRHDLELILELAPATSLITVMGDFNAIMGNNHNRTISGWDAVGHFSNPKITTPGQEWRDYPNMN